MKRAWPVMCIICGLGLPPSYAFAEKAIAQIQATSEGLGVAGEATLADTPAGLQVEVHVEGASPGRHGLHIHQYGLCSDHGNAAGSHYNPHGAPHGFLPTDGIEKAHPGDLGNIDVGPDGSGHLDVVLSGVTLNSGPNSVAGRAIILHEQPDDFGQPTGNAGGRIGCGPILLSPDAS